MIPNNRQSIWTTLTQWFDWFMMNFLAPAVGFGVAVWGVLSSVDWGC